MDYAEKYALEKAEKKAELERIGNGVARALGGTFEVEKEWYETGRIILPNGKEITVTVDRYNHKGRVIFGARIPHELRQFKPYKMELKTEITVAKDRPIAAMAKEITRRLLTAELAEKVATMQAAKAQADDYAGRKLALAKRIAAKVGTEIKEEDRFEGRLYTNGFPYLYKVEVGDKTVTLDLHYVPEELAVGILDLVTAYKKANPDKEEE